MYDEHSLITRHSDLELAPASTTEASPPSFRMGSKSLDSAKATIAGIELHHMLRKGQHENSANMTIFEQIIELAA